MLEFKGGPIEKPKLVERLAGMANSSGGVILVGVVERRAEIKLADGIRNVENADQYKDDVMGLVDSKLKPRPPIDAFTFKLDDKNLVVFNVAPSLAVVAYEEHDRGGHYLLKYFVRRETHNRCMNAEEVERRMMDSTRPTRLKLYRLARGLAEDAAVRLVSKNHTTPTHEMTLGDITDDYAVFHKHPRATPEDSTARLFLPLEAIEYAQRDARGRVTVFVTGRVQKLGDGSWEYRPDGYL